MFILYFGGQKSGKSKLAELKTMQLAKNKKPFYLATYNRILDDKEMDLRIDTHIKQRKNRFKTIEEGFYIDKVIKKNNVYLIDCISMWIFNNIDREIDFFLKQLKNISDKNDSNIDIVFVLNDVTNGIIPLGEINRKFVDLTGIIGQKLVEICDEVYEVKFGIEIKLKYLK